MSELEGPVELDRAELGFLRFVANMSAEPESPLAAIPVPARAEDTRAGRESLIDRGLVDARSLRPDRELIRRLLVVSEPDARIRLLAQSNGADASLIDAFERAGAHVQIQPIAGGLRLAPVQDEAELLEEVRRRLPVRGSAGDFVSLELDAEEYLAFSLLAARAAHRHLRPDSEAVLAARLSGALHRLIDKNLATEREGVLRLRPFLDDLARAIASRSRLVLVRNDFGVHEWLTRDVTLVAVPGSLFQLHAARGRGVSIAELDVEHLQEALRETLEPAKRELEFDLTA